MSEKLKPCPFCGREATIGSTTVRNCNSYEHRDLDPKGFSKIYLVGCEDNSCIQGMTGYSNKKRVIKLWNTRVK